MDDIDYSKRELDVKFKSIEDKIDEFSKDQDQKHLQNTKLLNTIDSKVTLTNGKVRKLEKWQAGLIMAGSTALFLGSVIIGLVVYIYQYQLSQQATRITNLKTMVQTLQSK